jgi:hypothetical protein
MGSQLSDVAVQCDNPCAGALNQLPCFAKSGVIDVHNGQMGPFSSHRQGGLTP